MTRVKCSRRSQSCTRTGAYLTRKKSSVARITMPCSPGKWHVTGAYPMRCSLKLFVPAIILALPAVALPQSRFNVGTPLSQQEIKGFDFMIGPDGKELPPGHGSPKEGSAIFAKRCQVCHGQNGEGGAIRRRVLGSPGNPHRGPFR